MKFKNSKLLFRFFNKCTICLNFQLFLLLSFTIIFPSIMYGKKNVQSNFLVRDVILIEETNVKEKDQEKILPLPSQLVIGIDIKEDAYYKLSTIATGLLSKGMNMVVLPVDGIFERSGLHRYELGVKAGKKIEQYQIQLQVEVNTQLDIEHSEAPTRIYEISLFVDNVFVGSIQKSDDTFARMVENGKKEPPLPKFDPRYPVPGSKPSAISVNPLALAVIAFRGIKKQLNKSNKEKTKINQLRKISKSFSHNDKNGDKEILKVTISIDYHLISDEKN